MQNGSYFNESIYVCARSIVDFILSQHFEAKQIYITFKIKYEFIELYIMKIPKNIRK